MSALGHAVLAMGPYPWVRKDRSTVHKAIALPKDGLRPVESFGDQTSSPWVWTFYIIIVSEIRYRLLADAYEDLRVLCKHQNDTSETMHKTINAFDNLTMQDFVLVSHDNESGNKTTGFTQRTL